MTELSIQTDARSCRVIPDDGGDGCAFLLRGVQVAWGDITSDPGTAITRWWMHVRDRLADPGDIVAMLHPLLQRLVASPVATRFYTFSSHTRCCFSASSQYPWVTDGLPIIEEVDENGRYIISIRDRQAAFSVDHAVAIIEETLAASRTRPFHGSADDRKASPRYMSR